MCNALGIFLKKLAFVVNNHNEIIEICLDLKKNRFQEKIYCSVDKYAKIKLFVSIIRGLKDIKLISKPIQVPNQELEEIALRCIRML